MNDNGPAAPQSDPTWGYRQWPGGLHSGHGFHFTWPEERPVVQRCLEAWLWRLVLCVGHPGKVGDNKEAGQGTAGHLWTLWDNMALL